MNNLTRAPMQCLRSTKDPVKWLMKSQSMIAKKFSTSSNSYAERRAINVNNVTSKGVRSLQKIFSSRTEQQKTHKDETPLITNELVARDFLNLKNFAKEDIYQFMWTAQDLKYKIKVEEKEFQPLKGKTAALLFQRDDFMKELAELAIGKLGGTAARFNVSKSAVSDERHLKDSARMFGSVADILIAGVNKQSDLEGIAQESHVPVIAGCSDLLRPLTILAYFITIQEWFGYVRGAKIAWIGPGTNTLNSLLYGCAKLGVDLSVATPPGYEPDIDVMLEAMKIAAKTGASFNLGETPQKAAYLATAIITDPWFPPGANPQEIQDLTKDFAGYQINRKILKDAAVDWMFMHGLPHRSQEVTDDIFYGDESFVWQAIENKLWVTMAVILRLLQPYRPTTPMPKYVRG